MKDLANALQKADMAKGGESKHEAQSSKSYLTHDLLNARHGILRLTAQ